MIEAFKKIAAKKAYSYLAIKLAAFLIIIALADAAVGGILRHFFLRQSSGWDYRTKYAMEENKADMIVFGASRAQHCYHPEVFQKELQLSCFNAGRDGESILYHYAILKSILSRYSPKIAILDCEVDMFSENDYSYERISCLLPYYKTHPEIRPIIELRSKFEKAKLCSQIYPYNSLLFNIIIGNMEFNKKRHLDINGYLPLSNELDEPTRTVTYGPPYPLDTVKVNILRSFIADCKKANVKLYMVCSPYLSNIIGTETSVQVTKDVAKETNTPYMDLTNDTFFIRRSKLFDDTAHINNNGAEIFSARVVNELIKQPH
jgi:hypothetical protein